MISRSPLLFLIALARLVDGQADCRGNPRLPHCQHQTGPSSTKKECTYKPIWLIPGKASDCTRSSAQKVITIDPSSVVISPNPIQLPGCFSISMKVDVTDNSLPRNYFAKVDYNLWNLPQFSNLPCQNSSNNGCGGYGNNCYYCDICNSLTSLKSQAQKTSVLNQFSDMRCPSQAGSYNLRHDFCFSDWKELDKDGDCEIDFLQDQQLQQYKEALKALQQQGYGTMVAKFQLATNATNDQLNNKQRKEAEIQATIEQELERKRLENGWAVNDQQYITFRTWYVQYRLDHWHKSEYLPWLLYYNQIGCLSVSFDICDRRPSPAAAGFNDGPSWKCV